MQGLQSLKLIDPYDFLYRPKNGGYFFYFYCATLYPILPAWTFRGVSALESWGFLGAYRQRVVSLVPEGQSTALSVYFFYQCPQIGGLNRLRGNGSKQPGEGANTISHGGPKTASICGQIMLSALCPPHFELLPSYHRLAALSLISQHESYGSRSAIPGR